MMDEHQLNWKEMANIMMKINKKQRKCSTLFMLLTRSFVVRWKDELEPTWHLLHSSGNMHFVTYSQDLVSSTLLVGWTELREFYGLTGNHQVTVFSSSPSSKTPLNQKLTLNNTPCTTKFLTQPLKVLLTEYKVTCNSLDVLSTMYSLMKATRFTHLKLEGTTECRIVYNHHRKIAKNGNRWRNFSQPQNLLPGTQIIFVFADATSNFVLFWLCL
ncbi:hypothetical protein HKD37_04G010826 [Glycine soja]